MSSLIIFNNDSTWWSPVWIYFSLFQSCFILSYCNLIYYLLVLIHPNNNFFPINPYLKSQIIFQFCFKENLINLIIFRKKFVNWLNNWYFQKINSILGNFWKNLIIIWLFCLRKILGKLRKEEKIVLITLDNFNNKEFIIKKIL